MRRRIPRRCNNLLEKLLLHNQDNSTLKRKTLPRLAGNQPLHQLPFRQIQLPGVKVKPFLWNWWNTIPERNARSHSFNV